MSRYYHGAKAVVSSHSHPSSSAMDSPSPFSSPSPSSPPPSTSEILDIPKDSPDSPDYEALGVDGTDFCPIPVPDSPPKVDACSYILVSDSSDDEDDEDDSPTKVDAACSPIVFPGAAMKVDPGAAPKGVTWEDYRKRRLRAIAEKEKKTPQVFFGPLFGVIDRQEEWKKYKTLIERRRGKPKNGKPLKIYDPEALSQGKRPRASHAETQSESQGKRKRSAETQIESQGKRPHVPFARPITFYY